LENLNIFSGGYLSEGSPGMKAQTKTLTFSSMGYVSVISGLDLEILSSGSFEGSVTLVNSHLRIGPYVTVTETNALNIEGNGAIVMDGTWINTSRQPYINSVSLLGMGTWSFSLSSFTFATPVNFTGLLNVTNSPIALRPVPGVYFISRILGTGNSKIDAICDRFTSTVVNVPEFNDYTTISLNITNAYITRFTVVNKGNKSIRSGIIGSLLSSQGSFDLNLDRTLQVENLTVQSGNVAIVQGATQITNLNYFGGTLWQLELPGIFKVSNTTYFGSAALKSLHFGTTLVTDYLDCRQCESPNCGLPLGDWSRIQYSKTSTGCII